MFKGFVDDLKNSTGNSLRMTSLVVLAGFAGFIALCFLCAAAFVAVMQRYGIIDACLTVAAIFLVVMVCFIAVYARKQRRARDRAVAAARSAAKAATSAPLIDPMMVATGIQIARTLGLKKLVPLLALAGVAVGFMASRNGGDDAADGDDAQNDEADA